MAANRLGQPLPEENTEPVSMPSEPSALELKVEEIEQYLMLGAIVSILVLPLGGVPIVGSIVTPIAKSIWGKLSVAFLGVWLFSGVFRAYRRRMNVMDRVAFAVFLVIAKISALLFGAAFRVIWNLLMKIKPFATMVDKLTPIFGPFITWIKHKISPPPAPEPDPEPAPEPEPPSEPVVFFPGGPSTALLKDATKSKRRDADEYMISAAQGALERVNLYGVEVTGVQVGPSVATLDLQLASGMMAGDLRKRRDDLAAELETTDIVIKPGGAGGRMKLDVPLPPEYRTPVVLRSVLESKEYVKAKGGIIVPIGKQSTGQNVIYDLRNAPHMLVAGATGSGKSVFVQSMMTAILLRYTPDEIRLVLIDPKRGAEFGRYDGIPHLLTPVAKNAELAFSVLNHLVIEMNRRYEILDRTGARDLANANKALVERFGEKPLPFIVIVIDELAQLLMSGDKEITSTTEANIAQLAQMARGAGMHLILATQRPDAKILSGLIRTNAPTRVALKVLKDVESNIIIDEPGAERLLGNGDMWIKLDKHQSSQQKVRVQSAYLVDSELDIVIKWWQDRREQYAEAETVSEADLAKAELQDKETREVGLRKEALKYLLREGKATGNTLAKAIKVKREDALALAKWLQEDGLMTAPTTRKPGVCTLSSEERRTRLAELLGCDPSEVVLTDEFATDESESDFVTELSDAEAQLFAEDPVDDNDLALSAPDETEFDDSDLFLIPDDEEDEDNTNS